MLRFLHPNILQSVSCSLYTVGFGESISNLLQTSSNPWVARGFAIAALVLLTGELLLFYTSSWCTETY